MAQSILIADPKGVAGVAFATHLRGSPYSFVGTVSHGKALVDAIGRLSPWGVALDVTLPDHPATPGVGWVAAVTTLREIAPWLRIVATADAEHRALLPAALGSGARAYLEKPYTRDEIMTALAHAASERPVMNFYIRPRRVAKRVPARVVTLYATGSAPRRTATVLNMSESGVCLHLAEELPVRKVFDVEIDLQPGPTLTTRAQIVRTSRSDSGGYDHGAWFVDLDAAGRDRVLQFLARSLTAGSSGTSRFPAVASRL
jgi:DNA-binding NarL/FixJ family response regulator